MIYFFAGYSIQENVKEINSPTTKQVVFKRIRGNKCLNKWEYSDIFYHEFMSDYRPAKDGILSLEFLGNFLCTMGEPGLSETGGFYANFHGI